MSHRKFIAAAWVAGWLLVAVRAGADEENARVLAALGKVKKDVLAMDDSQQKEADWRADALRVVGRAQLRLGDREGALATLRQAVEATATINAESPNFGKPRTLKEIAETQREAGDAAAARETLARALEEVEKTRGETVKWNALLEVSRLQRELGNLDAAQAAARKALPLARAAQGSQRAWHLGAIATTLAAAGDAPGARELLKEAAQVVATIPDATEKAQALNNIAYDQVRMEDYDDAFRTASSIVDPRIQAHALIGIATEATITDPKQRVWGGLRGKGLSAQKRAVADRALREALPCARAIPSLPGRLQTLSRIAYARAEIRDFAGALEVAHAIPSFAPGEIHKESSGEFVENTKARAHVAIARLQGEAGERAAALRSLRTALPLAQAVASSNEKFYALQEVAEAYAELGEHARAQDVWAEAQALVALLPEPTRSRHLASLVQSKLKAHEIAAALQTAETIADRRVSEKVGALESIAIEQRKAGDRPGARETLRRALACLEAFRKLDPADRPERPKAHDGAGAALGGFGPEDELDEQTLASILRQYSVFLPAQMGDAAAAIKAAKALPGEADEKSNTLANVAQMVAASVDVPAGLEVAATLEDPRARLTAYSYVLHGMIDRLDEQAGKAPRP